LIFFGVGLVLVFNVVPAFLLREPRELGVEAGVGELAGAGAGTGGAPTNVARLLHIFLAHGFTWLGVQTMFVYMFAYARWAFFPGLEELDEVRKEELGQVLAIAFLVMNSVGFVLPVAVLQPMAKRIGLVRTHTLCIFLMALGYAGIVWLGGGDEVRLYALMGVVGIGWASVVSLPFAIVSDSVDKVRMGLFMGLFNLSVVVPQIFVSVGIGRWVESAVDKSLVFVISAGALGMSAVLWALLKEDRAEGLGFPQRR
jgi:maltose/moltooligosaccharide transporter